MDRFLEHSRIYYFENACQPEVFVGSADWMPRNFFRRVEVVFPIVDGRLRDRLVEEVLGLSLRDRVKARMLKADGKSVLSTSGHGKARLRSQVEFIRRSLGEEAKGNSSMHGPAGLAVSPPRVRLAKRPF